MSKTLKYILLIVLILLLGSIPLAMQREDGRIVGLVTDDHGIAIAGAAVEARNTMTGAVFRGVVDGSGSYKLEGLPQGRYSLWVRAEGHDSLWIREIIVDRGQAVRRDIRLAVSVLPVTSGGAE